MSMVRRLVDLLDADALNTLLDKRRFYSPRSNDERRKLLSRSYRGQIETFLNDLRREDLLRIFNRHFVLSGVRYRAGSLRDENLDSLVSYARSLFVRGDVPTVFLDATDDDFVLDVEGLDEDDETNAPDEDQADVDNDDDHLGDDATNIDPGQMPLIAEGDGGNESQHTPFGDLTSEWSRPRMISRILRGLDHDVPERLRQPRFAEMVKALSELGLEVGDIDGNLLTTEMDSPGMGAKLRLRRKQVANLIESGPPVTGFRVETTSLGWSEEGTPLLATVSCEATAVHLDSQATDSGPRMTAARRAEDIIVRQQPEFGGVTITHPARLSVNVTPEQFDEGAESTVDLGFVLAVLGALSGSGPVPSTVAIGSVTDDGRIISLRPVTDLLALIVQQPGLRTILVPHSSFAECPEELPGIDLIPVETLADAAQFALQDF